MTIASTSDFKKEWEAKRRLYKQSVQQGPV